MHVRVMQITKLNLYALRVIFDNIQCAFGCMCASSHGFLLGLVRLGVSGGRRCLPSFVLVVQLSSWGCFECWLVQWNPSTSEVIDWIFLSGEGAGIIFLWVSFWCAGLRWSHKMIHLFFPFDSPGSYGK